MTDSLGRRIAARRAQRRMTQRQLADLAGISIDVIRKVEQGQRSNVRLATLDAIAEALDVQPSELLDKPRGLMVGAEDAEIMQLRRTVLGVTVSAGPPLLDQLRIQLGEAWRSYWTGRYADCARSLPTVITAASTSGRPALTVLADARHLAASLLANLGLDDLAALAMYQATSAAEDSGNRLMAAGLAGSHCWLLMRQGLGTEGAAVATTAAAKIEPRMSAPVAEVAIWGELQRYAAAALIRAGQARQARELMTLAGTAAARVGAERPDRAWPVRVTEKAAGTAPLPGLGFGPPLVAVTAVDVEVKDERYRRALDLAQRVGPLDALSPAMRAEHLITVSWAQTMDYRSAEAVMSLRRAYEIAPEMLPHFALARQAVAELLPRRRTQRLPGLVALAERVGVPVE